MEAQGRASIGGTSVELLRVVVVVVVVPLLLLVVEIPYPHFPARAKRASDLTASDASDLPFLTRTKRAADLTANEASDPSSLTRAKRTT